MIKNQSPPAEASSVSSPLDEPDFLRDTAFVPAQLGDATETGGEAQPQAVPPPQFPPELVQRALGGTFKIVFGMIAEKRGDHWQLKGFEEDGLVKAWEPLTQILLAQLGSTEQGLLALAAMTTVAVVGGKIAQDATKQASLTASTKTPASGASSVSSASVAAAKPPAQNGLLEVPEE